MEFFLLQLFSLFVSVPKKKFESFRAKKISVEPPARGVHSRPSLGEVLRTPRGKPSGETRAAKHKRQVCPPGRLRGQAWAGHPPEVAFFFHRSWQKKKASQIPNTCPQQCTMPAYLICRALIAINFYPCTRRQHSVVTSMGFVLHSQYDPFLCRKMQKTWSEEPAASGVPVAGGPAWDRLPVQLDLEEQDGVEHERPDAAHQEGGLHPQPVRGKGRSQAPHRAVGGAGASPPQPCRCAGAALLCGPGHSQDGGSVRVRASLRDPTPSRSSTGDSKWVKGEEQWGGGMGGIDMLSVR